MRGRPPSGSDTGAAVRIDPPGTPPEASPQAPALGVLAAAEMLLCDRGVQDLELQALCAAAAVTPREFHEVFEDLDGCLLALFDLLAGRLYARVQAACAAESSWVGGVRAGVLAALGFLEDSPSRARFLLEGGLAAGSPLAAPRRHLVRLLAVALEERRPSPRRDASVRPCSDALVTAAASVVQARLQEDPPASLRALSGPLTALMIAPVLGQVAAREELLRPPASESSNGS